jgi:hypothetical protein
VKNYATGVGIQDAVLAGTTVIQNGTQVMTTTSPNDGLMINRTIDTLNSNAMSISMWFNTTEVGGIVLFFNGSTNGERLK